MEGLAEHFRNILVCQDKATLKLLEAGEALKKRYQLQSAITPASLLLSALAIANDCDVNYKMARNKRLHVEMALIRMTYIQKAVNAAQHAQQITQEKKTLDVKSTNTYEQAPATTSKVEEVKQPIIKKTVSLKKMKSSLLDSLDAEVTKEAEISKAPAVELSEENLKVFWKKYSDEKITSNRTKNIFKTSVLKLNDQDITVQVNSNFNKSALSEERNLIFYLREQLHAPELSITIEVDKTNIPEPEKPKRPQILSAREKYKLMRQVNPVVDELQKRFGLLPDK